LKVKINNFQSLGEVDFDIGPLTVLTGQSDCGKSAVIRALFLLHRNSGGLELVKHGKSKLSVTQELEDGTRVSIVKGKGVNSYFIGDKSFSKVGREIPEEVSTLLHTQELFLDKDQSLDLNFSRQFDTPFLLSDSTAIVTKAISSLSGINIIYSAIREGNSEIQKGRAKSEVLRSNISDLSKYEVLSAVVRGVSSSVEEAKALSQTIENKKTHIQNMQKMLLDLELLEARMVDLQPFSSRVDNFMVEYENLDRLKLKRGGLESALSKFSGISEYALTDVFSGKVKQLGIDIDKLVEVFKEISSTDFKREGLVKVYNNLIEAESASISTGEALSAVSFSIAELEKQVKVCPTCNRPL
jgi:AAA15 family ATPase/GTPase